MTSNVLKLNEDFVISGMKTFDEITALKSDLGLHSVLYLTPDTESDTAVSPNGFESVRSIFGENSAHIACIPSDFAYSVPAADADDADNNLRFLASIRQFAKFSNALDKLQRPTLIICKSNVRAGLVHDVYAAVRDGTTYSTLINSNIMGWHGRPGFEHWADTVVNAFNSASNKGLIFHQLLEKESSTYTYLLADRDTREAILIDPVLETVDRDFQLLKDLKLKLKYCINTHVHADHVTGSGILKRKVGEFNEEHNLKRRTLLSEGELNAVDEAYWKADKRDPCLSAIATVANAMADIKLDQGSSLQFGAHRLISMNTPGHTAGCMSFILGDGSIVFTGDALLIRGCGRTDFQEGSSNTLYDSVHSQLFSLPNTTQVWPAHNYTGLSSTTIGDERRLNPRLAAEEPIGPISKTDFYEIMENLKLPYPRKLDISLPANLKCGV